MSKTIGVSDTLAVEVSTLRYPDDKFCWIERVDGGLVNVKLAEIPALVGALVEVATRLAAGPKAAADVENVADLGELDGLAAAELGIGVYDSIERHCPEWYEDEPEP